MLAGIVMAVLAADPSVSVQFEGTLHDALKEIANKGHLNVLIAGELKEPVQVHLADLSAEEAITSVAKAYGLEVSHEGKMLIVRANSGPSTPLGMNAGPLGAVAPVVPVPEVVPEVAERLRDAAERESDKAEALRDQVRDLKEAAKARVEAGEHDVVAAGGPVTVPANTRVESAVAYGGSVNVEDNAVVEGDAVSMGGDVVLGKNAEVEGDAVAMGGRVILGEGARVHGEQVSLGASSLGVSMARGALKTTAGVAPMVTPPMHVAEDADGDRFSLAGFLVNFAFFFGVGFLMLVFAPQRMKNIELTLRSQPVVNGLIGFIGLMAAVPISFIVGITIIGIPLVFVGWLLVALSVPVGVAAIANQIGTAVPTGKVRKTQALVLALGLLVVMLVTMIPYLGKLALAFALMAALGAIFRSRFGRPAKGMPVVDGTYLGAPA